jgi:hypothetical protein
VNSTTALFALTIAGALASLIVYHASLAREERELLRETSRFSLFAARDKLIWLAASEQMSEDEAAWKNAYRAVNSLMGLHQPLHLVDLLSRYAKHLSRLETDSGYRQQFQRVENVEREAGRRIPNFAVASRAIDDGFAYMVRKRTRAVHVLIILVVCGGAIVLRTVMTAGVKVAAHVARAMSKPEGIGAKYFNVQVC